MLWKVELNECVHAALYQLTVCVVQTLLLLPPDIDTRQCCGESTRRYVKVDTHGVDRDAECSDEDDATPSDELELMTWKTILCRKSTLTACLAYVHTSCIYIVYGNLFQMRLSVASGPA